MEENRDQILLDFQSCTGVEDIAECIMYLEATNWNLLDAINNVMPAETQTLPSEQEEEPMVLSGSSPPRIGSLIMGMPLMAPPMRPQRPHIQEILLDEDRPPALPPLLLPSPGATSAATARLSSVPFLGSSPVRSESPTRILNFIVKYKDKSVPLEVPESEPIATLKTALFAELGVPPCRQELNGFRRNHLTDQVLLSSLNLSNLTNLSLNEPEPSGSLEPDQENFFDRLNTTYCLRITDETSAKPTEHTFKFPGCKTILEVKQDIYSVTNIPVRFQRWSGWPDSAQDENMTLAAVGLSSPTHHLVLRQDGNKKVQRKPVVDITGSESSGEDFEDAAECFTVEDDMFQADSSSSTRPRRNRPIQGPLMPPEVGCDEAAALSHFSREFANRYGECHPAFYEGSLAEALQASCHKPAKERKPLVVYLHHDASVLTNVFCTQLLCSDTIVTYLALNFLTWAWDLSSENNKARFLASVSQQLGMAASSAIRNISVDVLPAMMVIGRVRATTEVLTVIPGNVSLDELMTRLLQAREMFNSSLSTEIREEEERYAREEVKREQDAAYEESLMADRQKEEARKQEEEQRQQREQAEQQQIVEQEKNRQHQEAVKEAIRQSLADQVPTEPPEDSTESLIRLRVRLPSGEVLVRRFLATDTLRTVHLFLGSRGFPITDYKVLSSWPRRDLATLDPKSTLHQLKIAPQEMVTLEER